MSSDSVVRDLFRSLESSLHERLGMIEDVIRMRLNASPQEDDGSADRIRALEELVATLTDRLVALEMTREEAKEVHVHRVGAGGEEIAPAPAAAPKTEEIWIEPMRDLKIELPAAVTPVVVPEVVVAKPLATKPVATKPIAAPLNKIVEEPAEEEEEVVEEEVVEEEVVEEEVVEEEVVEEEVVEEEVVEEEVVEEEVVEEEVVEEEVVEEEVVEEEVVEEEGEAEAEEGVAVEQFEYKGKTYFRDSDNQVYAASKEDPDQPDENPIGTWDTARERILFRRA